MLRGLDEWALSGADAPDAATAPAILLRGLLQQPGLATAH
jgi:hypothetical protein